MEEFQTQDRQDDALRLAQMAMMRDLKAVHIPAPEIREQRTLIKSARRSTSASTGLRTRSARCSPTRGVEIDSGKPAWRLGRACINSFRQPLTDCAVNELWRGKLDLELTQLDDLTLKLKAVEKRAQLLAADNMQVQRLMRIPGVGRITAEA